VEPDPIHVENVRAYCQAYIEASCWEGALQHKPEKQARLWDLRARITDITSAQALDEWLDDALALGIDPL
jgi:hypothetical protein